MYRRSWLTIRPLISTASPWLPIPPGHEPGPQPGRVGIFGAAQWRPHSHMPSGFLGCCFSIYLSPVAIGSWLTSSHLLVFHVFLCSLQWFKYLNAFNMV